MKIGILGGTFNPIHKGHINLAKEVKRKLGLEKIIFVPAYIPPHKSNADIISATDRFKMVRLAIKDEEGFSASDLEIKRKGKSYSVDTLKSFKKSFKAAQLYFIIGADSLAELDKWKDIEEIFKLARFVVVNRAGFSLRRLPEGALRVNIRPQDVSSTQVRRLIRKGEPIRRYVTNSVLGYIIKKGLYH